MKSNRKAMAISSLSVALCTLSQSGSRITDKKEAIRFITETVSDSKRAAALTKKGRWEEVVWSTLMYVKHEGRSNKQKRAQQEDVGLFLVSVVRRAPLREGAWPLVPLVEALVTDALLRMDQEATVGSALQLLEILLKEAKYCEGMSRGLAERCMQRLMRSLEEDDERNGLDQTSISRARSLANLIANYRRDFVLEGDRSGGRESFLRGVVRFAGRWAGRHGIAEARKAGVNAFPDVAEEVLATINALLLKYGVDCAPHLAMGGHDQDMSYGEAVLSLALQCLPNLRASKIPTFFEHVRLQLHLARARLAFAHPWLLDAGDYMAHNLDNVWEVVVQDCLVNAGQHVRAHGAGGKKGREETWVPLEYRGRLSLVLAAEVLFAIRALRVTCVDGQEPPGTSVAVESGEKARGGGETEVLRGEECLDGDQGGGRMRGPGQMRKRQRLASSRGEAGVSSIAREAGSGSDPVKEDPMGRIYHVLRMASKGNVGSREDSARLGRRVQAGCRAGFSDGDQVRSHGQAGASLATQNPGSQPTVKGTQDRVDGGVGSGGARVSVILAHLQLLAAVLENLPSGGELWVLCETVEGEGFVELVGVLENLLVSRRESVLLLWTLVALLALAHVCTRRPMPVFPSAQLGAAWGRVLHTILRPDLKCWSATGRLDSQRVGLGDGVLRLLIKLVSHPILLSEATLARNQDLLWRLPAFQSVQDSLSAINLLHALLQRGEISDGHDSIASVFFGSTGVVSTSVPCVFLDHAHLSNGGVRGNGESSEENENLLRKRQMMLPQARSRAERVSDFLMGFLSLQLFRSHASIIDRCRAIARAMAALVDLIGASRYRLRTVTDEDGTQAENCALPWTVESSFAVGKLRWSLSSPWRVLAEEEGRRRKARSLGSHTEAEGGSSLDESGTIRHFFCIHGERNLWRDLTRSIDDAGTTFQTGATFSTSGMALTKAAATGYSTTPTRGFSPDLRGITVPSASTKTAKLCSAGGHPLRRRCHGRRFEENDILGDARAVQMNRVAVRAVRHVEAWTEAIRSSLFGSSAQKGSFSRECMASTNTQAQVNNTSIASNIDGVHTSCYLLIETLFLLLAVRVDEATVEAGELKDENDSLDAVEDEQPSDCSRVVLMTTRVEELLGRMQDCLHCLSWPGMGKCEGLSRSQRGLREEAEGFGEKAVPGAVAEAGALVLDVSRSLLEELPLTFAIDGVGGLEKTGLWVESTEGLGGGLFGEEKLPRGAHDVLRFFRSRIDEALSLILPEGSGEVIHGNSYDETDIARGEADEEGGYLSDGETSSSFKYRHLNSTYRDEDDLMADSDDEDEVKELSYVALASQRQPLTQHRGKGIRVRMGHVEGRQLRRENCAFAWEISKNSPFSARQLAAWARLALVLNPTNPCAYRYIKAASSILLDDRDLDLAKLWFETLFLMADPEDYVQHLAELQGWVNHDLSAVALSFGSTARREVTTGQEIRLNCLWRLLQQLCSRKSPSWLVEGLGFVQDRLWSSFTLVEREELSWYNRCMETDARHALFEASNAVRGDDGTRKLFLTCLVHSARHGDSEVRLSMSRALPAVFLVYPNSLSVWEQYRRQGVLSGPGEGPDTKDRASTGSRSHVTLSQSTLSTLHVLQRRLGLLMAFGTAAQASHKVTRLAILTLCRWWGSPTGAMTGAHIKIAELQAAKMVRPMVEAVISSIAGGLEYPSVAALLREHLMFLLHEWLVVHRLPLLDFPLHMLLLDPESGEFPLGETEDEWRGHGRRASKTEEGEEDVGSAGVPVCLNITGARCSRFNMQYGDVTKEQEALLQAFVGSTLSILVPIACLASGGDPPTYRLDLLDNLALAAGSLHRNQKRKATSRASRKDEHEDPTMLREGRIASLISAYIVEIKALEFLLLSASTVHKNAGLQLADLQGFLQRSFPKAGEEELNSRAGLDPERFPQDVIVSMLDLLSTEPPLASLPSGATSKSALCNLEPSALGPALQALAERILGASRVRRTISNNERGKEDSDVVDLTELWSNCNPVELLFHLKVRLAQASNPVRAQRLLEVTKELLMNLGPVAQSPAALHVCIHLMLWALERHAFALTLSVLDMLESYLDAVLDHRSADGHPVGAERLRVHLGGLVVSLFTILVQLRVCTHRRPSVGGTDLHDDDVISESSLLMLPLHLFTPSINERASSSFVLTEDETGAIAAKVVCILHRLIIQESSLKRYICDLDPLPRLTIGSWFRESDALEHTLEEVRVAIVRATTSATIKCGTIDQGESRRQLIAHAKRFTVTLARSAGQGRAGQFTRLVALQALLHRLSPIQTSADDLYPSQVTPLDPGPEVRRLLVPALLSLCRPREWEKRSLGGRSDLSGASHRSGGSGTEEISIRLEAARVLGALGAVPPSELVLWVPATHIDQIHGNKSTSTSNWKKRSFGAGSSRRSLGASLPAPPPLLLPATPCESIVGKALKILLGLLTSSDAHAVQLAVLTLRSTLLRSKYDETKSQKENSDLNADSGRAVQNFEIRPWMKTIWKSRQHDAVFDEQEAALLQSFERSSTKSRIRDTEASYRCDVGQREAFAASYLVSSSEKRLETLFPNAIRPVDATFSRANNKWCSRRIWDPRRLPYEDWITQLVWTLAQEVMVRASGREIENHLDNCEQDECELTTVRRFLIQCSGTCRSQPVLAEVLLPVALFCLVRLERDCSLTAVNARQSFNTRERADQQQQGEDEEKITREWVCQQLTRCIRLCLSRASPRPSQALISALTFLRMQSIHEALQVRFPSSPLVGKSVRRKSTERTSPSPAHLEAHEAVAAVGGMMGLGLNKLEIARAAIRCGALTAATLYLELHVEDERQHDQLQARQSGIHEGAHDGTGRTQDYSRSVDRISRGICISRGKKGYGKQDKSTLLLGEVGEVESLLLRISGRLAEPDGADGVQEGTGLEGRMRAAAAQGSPDWRQALAEHDCLLQRWQGQNASRASHSSTSCSYFPANDSKDTAISAGSAIALQKLDLGHVLDTYLAGLKTRTDIGHETALRELEFETSWRACRWQQFPIANYNQSSLSALWGPNVCVARHQPSLLATTAHNFGNTALPLSLDDDQSIQAWHQEGNAVEDLAGGPSLSLLRRHRYHEHIHAGLRALAAGDNAILSQNLRAARLGLLSCLAEEIASEPSRFLSPVLARLQSLQEMEEVAALRAVFTCRMAKSNHARDLHAASLQQLSGQEDYDAMACNINATSSYSGIHSREKGRALIDIWQARSHGAIEDDFELAEPVLAVQEVLIRALCPPLDCHQALVRHAQGIAAAARAAGNLTIAASVMDRVESLLLAPGASPNGVLTVERCVCKLEQARILWANGKGDLAIRTVTALAPALETLDQDVSKKCSDEARVRGLEIQARQLAGRWMAIARSESTQRIIDGHLRPAVDRAGADGGTPAQRRQAHLTLADFLTDLYQRRSERLKSDEMVRQAELLQQRKVELEVRQREYEGVSEKDPKCNELRRRIGSLKKELALDEADFKAQVDSLSGILLDALKHFRQALCFDGLVGGGHRRKTTKNSCEGRPVLASDSEAKEHEEEDGSGCGDDDDLGPIFKVVALWFDPVNAGSLVVNAELAKLVLEIPTYKVVPLIYQILSRLGSGTREFSSAVELLVFRTCKEHPHHTLLQLFALRHGKTLNSAAARETYNRMAHLEEKVQAAQGILNRLLSSGCPVLAALVTNTEKLLDGYIKLASIKRTQEMKQSRNLSFVSLTAEPAVVRSFPDILRRGAEGPRSGTSSSGVTLAALPAVLTKSPPLDPMARYDAEDQAWGCSTHVVRVERFESRFALAESGLSRPLIIACLGTDGRRYRQVLKADDVRSDAIMMQVFEMMNTLLCRDPRARRRALHIRTYRVVPMTPECGALEFVEDTKTLGGLLVASDSSLGLHERYNGEDDFSSRECRELLRTARTSEERRDAYQTITENFHPAFRFFFLESFPDPAVWYRKRLYYTRSVAVSSIVGYVLGIGDRHASNILVDQATAGLVHIDFGYTFEQGKVLPQPETVPFRLTRDLVDAMGVTGTEGVFRQCCNTTMAVLRQHAPSLLTILEVCVHDPLHSWIRAGMPGVLAMEGGEEARAGVSAVSGKANCVSGGDEEEEEEGSGRHRRGAAHKVLGFEERKACEAMRPNSDAERALLRIRQKLKGYEDPGGDAMSTEGHVKYLISQATDPDNLCRIFVGWSPWL
ncbi:serine-protein kinase atm [Nannochloropsis gaditana]|uniref:non-specific serine/threonine protein kinase n=2 Tax=Nannochloropsis gaditana TaxID=72520 RepID=W7TZ19_9STRA|nr:serine-protein kinase atm [Nannochloropsis gaditana]